MTFSAAPPYDLQFLDDAGTVLYAATFAPYASGETVTCSITATFAQSPPAGSGQFDVFATTGINDSPVNNVRTIAFVFVTRVSVDKVAAAVGYGDTTALRRLMKKAVGTTPGRVRAAAGVSVPRPARR